jgi:hypothetical protein
MARLSEKVLRVSSPTQARCAGCGRKIKKNMGQIIDGRRYGPECADRVLEQLNLHPTRQETFL